MAKRKTKMKATEEHDAMALDNLMNEFSDKLDDSGGLDSEGEEDNIMIVEEELQMLAFRVPVGERAEFKEWCVRHGMPMRQAFSLAFKLLKAKHGS